MIEVIRKLIYEQSSSIWEGKSVHVSKTCSLLCHWDAGAVVGETPAVASPQAATDPFKGVEVNKKTKTV